MNLQEIIKQTLREMAEQSEDAQQTTTLADILKETLKKQGIDMTEEEENDFVAEVEDKIAESDSISTDKGTFKKSLPGIEKGG